jgi:hypothetical protein
MMIAGLEMNSETETFLRDMLKAQRSPYTLEMLRAFIMGTILAPEVVMPSHLMDEILPSEESVEDPEDAALPFESASQAERFFKALMLLWNELTIHQSPNRPFFFSPVPDEARDGEEFIDCVMRRHTEMGAFLEGLELGGYEVTTSVPELEYRGPEDSDLLIEHLTLPQILSLATFSLDESFDQLESYIAAKKKAEEDNQAVSPVNSEFDFGELWGAMRLGERGFNRRYPAFVEQVKRERFIQMATRKALDGDDDDVAMPLVRTEPKLGRNDPCFCGSGKKFKKCCLQ